MEVLTGDIELGSLIIQRIGGIQFGEVLCADVEGSRAGAVHSGDEHSDILVIGQVGVLAMVKTLVSWTPDCSSC